MVTLSVSYASDVFSHTILTLPDHPKIENPWSRIISDQKDWESFFYAQTAHITYLQGEAPVAEKIDFEKYQVLTGGLGVKPNGGYSLTIESVVEQSNAIQVHILDIKPDTDCFPFMAMTYPSATILVKKTDKPFKFISSLLIRKCPVLIDG